jgi:hypothetical protein
MAAGYRYVTRCTCREILYWGAFALDSEPGLLYEPLLPIERTVTKMQLVTVKLIVRRFSWHCE